MQGKKHEVTTKTEDSDEKNWVQIRQMKDINAQLLLFFFFFSISFDWKITQNSPSIAYDSHDIPSNNDGCLSNN